MFVCGNQAVTKSAFQRTLFAAALVVNLGITVAAQADQPPPKELLQYVHDAKRRGMTDAKIKQQAVAVGWAAALVDQAISTEKGGGKALAANSSDVAASNPKLQPSSNAPQPEPVPAVSVAAAEKATPPASVNPTTRAGSDDYLIGAGDTLQISVWKEPEASVPSAVVRPDGKISMPLIKEIVVAGLTPLQAETAITTSISKFISDPNVTLVVAGTNSKKVYLIGAVRKEGTLPYTYGMTVMQALSEAGGLTDYARRKKIYILRTESGREYRLDFNYDEVIKGERMDQNVVLLPGDTVVIPQ
jgi:polysaccharide export outer membrane protein